MENSYEIKVAIAEDHVLVREGIKNLIQKNKRLKVVISAGDGQELLDQMHVTPVDIVILDIEMPIMNGKEALKEIIQRYKNTRVIMLSMYFENVYIEEFTILGARSFLPKNIQSSMLIDAIISVHDQGHYFHEEISKLLLAKMMDTKTVSPKANSFDITEQERKVLKLICQEKNSTEIAEELFLSKRTVEHIREDLLEKTESKNVAGLIIYAILQKIVNLNDFNDKSF
jgi:DNA-binding NarL/FixJ family response regulator